MAKQGPSQYKPPELANTVAALFLQLPPTDLTPVEMVMQYAIQSLEGVGFSKLHLSETELAALAVPPLDLSDPDDGIPHALRIEQGKYPQHVKAAGRLLRTCLHARERGHTVEHDRTTIPMVLAALSGFVPDWQSEIASAKRGPRDLDTLQENLDREVKNDPGCSTEEYISRLEADDVLSQDEDGNITFLDLVPNKEIKITMETFRNRVTRARKKHTTKGQT